jgi:hypothetical protein
MFNNYLHFIEIKAVLEGRGFSPPLRSAQTFGNQDFSFLLIAGITHGLRFYVITRVAKSSQRLIFRHECVSPMIESGLKS